MLDDIRAVKPAIVKIRNRLGMTEQLDAVEIGDLVQQGSQPTPLPQQGNGFGELHLVIQFSEADHVAAPSAENWAYGPREADIVPFDARRGCVEPASNRAPADNPIAESAVSVRPALFDSRTACLDLQNTAEGRAIPGKDGGFI